MPNAIVLGDKATCTGPVSYSPGGPSTVFINDISVAREGEDLVHLASIDGLLGAAAEVYVEGFGIAVVGDTVIEHTVGDSEHKNVSLLESANTTVFVG